MYHLSAIAIALTACYRDGTVAKCAVSCDPLDTANRCPGDLLCGTDKFCHPEGESSMACTFEKNDATAPPDAAFRDAPPVDAIPTDAFTMCAAGTWQADFDADPTVVSAHYWRASGFDYTKDVTDMAWTPTLAKESLSTAPSIPFTGLTVFQAKVDVLMIDAYVIDLHLNAGDATQAVDVDVSITRGANMQRWMATLTSADGTKTMGGGMSVDPHVMTGKLDYTGHTFELLVDGASQLTFSYTANAPTKSSQLFTVTADTNTMVDDLGVCAN